VWACGDVLECEYRCLLSAAAARPPGERGVTTGDLWEWVSLQSGDSFSDVDINNVLLAADVEDERDVTLGQFTQTVVHMFASFFAMLDVHGTGYITKVRCLRHTCLMCTPSKPLQMH
jgi:hypothetical protein